MLSSLTMASTLFVLRSTCMTLDYVRSTEHWSRTWYLRVATIRPSNCLPGLTYMIGLITPATRLVPLDCRLLSFRYVTTLWRYVCINISINITLTTQSRSIKTCSRKLGYTHSLQNALGLSPRLLACTSRYIHPRLS